MKVLIAICLALISIDLQAQSLSIFDIDTTNFPIMKAKFYAFDKEGNQITNLAPSDFEIKEDGIDRKVLNVSCPIPEPLQKVSIAMSIDVSGSMGYSNFGEIPVELGKTTANELCNLVAMPPSEFALQTCHHRAFLVQDFTSDKDKVLTAINPIKANGDNDFVEHFLNKLTGLLNITKTGKHKRVAVLYTDAWWYSLTTLELQKCKDTCSKYNIQFFAVIYSNPKSEPNGIKKSLQELADFTGGFLFDGVTTTKAAKEIGLKLEQIAQGRVPCEITWETDITCLTKEVDIDFGIKIIPSKVSFKSKFYSDRINFEFFPKYITFIDPIIGKISEQSIKITAKNGDFNIDKIILSNDNYSINQSSFKLKNGASIVLKISNKPQDNAYSYCKMNLISDKNCIIGYDIFSINKGNPPSKKTLKLKFPNGNEKLIIGSDTTISWEGVSESDMVTLDYSTNMGETWNLLSKVKNSNKYVWKNIPKPSSVECLVRVTQDEFHNDADPVNYIPKIIWEKSYGGSITKNKLDYNDKEEIAKDIIKISDGNYVVVGYTTSNQGDVSINKGALDWWIIKINSITGDIIWEKTLGGPDWDEASKVIETFDGKIVVAGYSRSDSRGDLYDGSGANSNNGIWLVKIDPFDGNIIWKKSYGDFDSENVNSIIEASDSNLVICGTKSYRGYGIEPQNDFWIIKVNYLDASIMWEKKFGGSNYDISYSIIQSTQGYYLVVGSSESKDGDLPKNYGLHDIWLLKLDPTDGSILLNRTYGGKSPDIPKSIIECNDGSFVIAGLSYSIDIDLNKNKGHSDYWIFKIDSAKGDIIWQKTYGGSDYDEANSIIQCDDGSLVVAGFSESIDGDVIKPSYLYGTNYWILKLRSLDGSIIWKKAFGGRGDDDANSIIQTDPRIFVVAGSTDSEANNYYDGDGDVSNYRYLKDFWIVTLNEGKIFQEDTSDSFFSIVKPIPSSIDIDFNKCLVGSIKDSLVQNFVLNSGSWRFRVDSIYFRGADAAAFSLVSGLPKYDLDEKEGKNTEFRFSPKKVGIHQAEIVIITQSDTLIQKISGEGVAPELAVNSNWLDFGKVPLKYSKTISDTILITNISQKELKIDSIGNIGPDATQFIILDDTKAFTLQSNESKKLNMKFEPKEVGRTSGQVAFFYNNFSSPAIIQLFGEGIDIKPKLSTNNPVCEGEKIMLFADSIDGAKFFWTGPNNFKSTEQNPIIDDANNSHIGSYSASVIYDIYSSDTSNIDVMVGKFDISPGDSSLIFLGSAERRGISIQLTYPRVFDAGSIWLKNKFSVLNDFSTSFQFITGNGNNNGMDDGSFPGADGFALVFQSNNYPIEGARGGSIGYTGIPKSLAIEIDLFNNDWDENGNHIAVQSLKTEGNQPYHDNSTSCLGINQNILEIKHSKYYFCKVDYILKEKELKIYIDSTGKFDEVSLMVPNIDFSDYLQLDGKDHVFIGITSATGNAYQNHNILNWRFPCKNIILSQDEGTRIIPLKNELMIYPNPASNNLNIIYSLNKQSDIQFKIINNLGIEMLTEEIIKNQEIGQYNYQINIDKLPLGIYHIVLKTNTDQLIQTLLKID